MKINNDVDLCYRNEDQQPYVDLCYRNENQQALMDLCYRDEDQSLKNNRSITIHTLAGMRINSHSWTYVVGMKDQIF